MTIPTRPAPAPPGTRNSASASANASIEQLRLQLQQQQHQQQQTAAKQNITIKLPPPPKRPNAATLANYSNNNNSNSNNSSITRKFPPARYSPATDWDDAPFGGSAAATNTNGNFKKVPPPRPPPPRVLTEAGGRGRLAGGKATPAPAAPTKESGILSIFQRKKAAAAQAQKNGASRVYGLSSGTTTKSTSLTTSNSSSSLSYTSATASTNWNDNWNVAAAATNFSAFSSSVSSGGATTHMLAPEPQLISFDSPPSSPTFTQKSNSDCVSVDSFSSDSNFSSPNNGSVSQPESGFEDDFGRSRPATRTPLDPWESLDAFGDGPLYGTGSGGTVGTAPVRNLTTINSRMQATSDNLLCNGKSLLPPPPTVSMPTIIKPKISQKPKAPKPPALRTGGVSVFDADLPTPPSPPMPMQAPPPPPSGAMGGASVSLLDVISGKVDALQLVGGASGYVEAEDERAYGIALYNFDGTEDGDLAFRENEKIYLLEKVSEEWYRGRTRTGCEGIFPGNYIDIKVPLSNGAPSTNGHASSGAQVRCLYNFPAEVEGDLAVKENEMVTVLYKINEDWLFGEVNGRSGQFPANFLEYVPANLPTS